MSYAFSNDVQSYDQKRRALQQAFVPVGTPASCCTHPCYHPMHMSYSPTR